MKDSELFLDFVRKNSIMKEGNILVGLRQNEYRDFTLYSKEEAFDVTLIYYEMINEEFIVGEIEAPFLEEAKGSYIKLKIMDFNLEIQIELEDIKESSTEEKTYIFVSNKIKYKRGFKNG